MVKKTNQCQIKACRRVCSPPYAVRLGTHEGLRGCARLLVDLSHDPRKHLKGDEGVELGALAVRVQHRLVRRDAHLHRLQPSHKTQDTSHKSQGTSHERSAQPIH